MDAKHLVKHLGRPGEPGAISRSEASTQGAQVKALLESEGWAVLMELKDGLQRTEQKRLMRDGRQKEDDAYERVFGMWQGMDRVAILAEGMVALGELASREMESGEPAATAAS